MQARSHALRGSFTLVGLPPGLVVVDLFFAQLGDYVAGTLTMSDTTGGSLSQTSFNVQGNAFSPSVSLIFSASTDKNFSFTGAFESDGTVVGTLGGAFTGPARLLPAAGR